VLDPPGSQDPPSPEPPPSNDGGGVTIARTGQSFATLQEAIAQSDHGDVLELEPGIYRETIDVTRGVTLRSTDGAAQTILDGNDEQRPLSGSDALVGRTLRLEGITLRFGRGDPGGAIWMTSGTLECVDCVFDRCTSPDRAGAVSVQASGAADAASAVFENCVFRECQSDARGGAVFLTAGTGSARVDALFRRCRFEGNLGNQGGAVFASVGAGTATVDVDFENCIFADNRAKDGGAVLAESGAGQSLVDLELRGCLIVRNEVTGEGSAVRARAVAEESKIELHLIHCTIADNIAPDLTGFRAAVTVTRGVSQGSARLLLLNSIVWANAPRQLEGAHFESLYENNIVMNWALGGSNLDLDPRFVFPEGDNYLLRAGSPAIDAADPLLVPAELVVDLAGEPRIRGAGPDIGAFEQE